MSRSLRHAADGGLKLVESAPGIYDALIDPTNLVAGDGASTLDGIIVSVSGEPMIVSLADFIILFFNGMIEGTKMYLDKTSESYIVKDGDAIKFYRDDTQVGEEF